MDEKSICCILFLSFLNFSYGSWGSPDSSQYHIQTDEGPERYFRYQTDNGQFRKEKRLKDGTVIGTDAWISQDGYLRQKDYIADKDGYRILKSKTVFVGRNRPIQDAINEAKSSPAQSGILVPSSGNQIISDAKPAVALKSAFSPSSELHLPPISSTLAPPLPVISSTTPAPPVTQIYLPPSSSSTPRHQNEANLPPLVIYNKQSPTSTPSPVALIDNNYYTESPAAVHITPYNPSYYPISTPASINESHLPPLVVYNGQSSTYQSPVTSTTPRPVFVTSTHQPGLFAIVSPNSEPKIQKVSALSNELLPPKYVSQNVIASTTPQPVAINAYQFKPYYSRYSLKPVESKSQYYNNKNSQLYKLGDGYNPQYANYDGVSATNNGFRYFLPRQYHEEQNAGNGQRDGSFGYIDPFGIRRVVYYNAGPDGFVHRKNNRYVGFNATPYDPRPV